MPRYARRSYRTTRRTTRPYRRSIRTTGRRSSYKSRHVGRGVTKRYVSNAINRNENKKLALQTKQLLSTSVVGTTSLAGSLSAYPMWSPGALITAGIFSSGTDAKLAMRSMQQTVLITNQSNLYLYLRIVKVKARKLMSIAFSPLLFLTEVGAYPAINFPFGDYTTGATFRRYMKIKSNKTRTVRPGGVLKLHRKAFWPRGKMMTGQVEGNSTIASYPGMYLTYVMYCSYPYAQRGVVSGITGAVGNTDMTCAVVHVQKATFHLMEDRQPTSTINSSAATVGTTYVYNTGPAQLGTTINQADVDLSAPPENNSRQPRITTLEVPR